MVDNVLTPAPRTPTWPTNRWTVQTRSNINRTITGTRNSIRAPTILLCRVATSPAGRVAVRNYGAFLTGCTKNAVVLLPPLNLICRVRLWPRRLVPIRSVKGKSVVSLSMPPRITGLPTCESPSTTPLLVLMTSTLVLRLPLPCVIRLPKKFRAILTADMLQVVLPPRTVTV